MQVDWWTLALQTVNVLVLIWLLARFLFRPVADIVARRQQEANKLLTDAAALKQDTEQARAEMERVRATFVKEREQIIAEAHAAAEAARAALLAQTDDEVTKRRAQADAAIAQDRVAMEKALIDAARELSIEIARRLLQRAAPAASLDAFLPGLSQQVQALSAQERAVFTSNDSRNHPVEVVTACALSTEEAERIRGAITAAFCGGPALVFRSDPSVIAGIELHSRHGVVRNSWRGDFDRIRQELSGDGLK